MRSVLMVGNTSGMYVLPPMTTLVHVGKAYESRKSSIIFLFYDSIDRPEESIEPLDRSLRILFESRCHVAFPCSRPKCQTDFSSLCPSDWSAVVDDDTCIVRI